MKSTDYVLYHISIGRTLNYHSIPPHLYWKGPGQESNLRHLQEGVPDLNGSAVFTRGDNGWTQGLHPLDRFIKNTHEILSPLHELTAEAQLADHEFLSHDRKVQRSVFLQKSEKTEVVMNASRENLQWWSNTGGRITLPPNGFLVESPPSSRFTLVPGAACRILQQQRHCLPCAAWTAGPLSARPKSASIMASVMQGWNS